MPDHVEQPPSIASPGEALVPPAPGRSQPLLEVEGMTARYGETLAVDNVSFSVRDGEFFTLLGPSGCGKSTTLMSLAGFELPAAGAIHLGDREITRLAPEARGMGVVFQSYALFPHMNALENVAFPLKMRGLGQPDRERKAHEVLELVELAERSRTSLPANLSGGQQQRVALARAIVFDPAVLLMDEPLAALDRRLRESLQFELRRLQARLGTTVVYVTHDQEEALVLSDRIAVMRAGRFEQIGSPQEIYQAPANAFVAGFLGNSNTLRVAVVEHRGDRAAVIPKLGEAQAPLWVMNGDVPEAAAESLMLVRPENVRLGNERPGCDESGCTAEVGDVAYLGDHIRVEVRAFEGRVWTVPIPAKRRVEIPLVGSQVWITWRVEDARLVPLD